MAAKAMIRFLALIVAVSVLAACDEFAQAIIENPCPHDITLTLFSGSRGSPPPTDPDSTSIQVVESGETLRWLVGGPSTNRLMIEELEFEVSFDLVDDQDRFEVIVPVELCHAD